MKKQFCLFLLLFSLQHFAAAQQDYLYANISSYDRHEGFNVDETMNHISTDNKGYLWISSLSGLYRFSGSQFKTFPQKKNVDFTLPGNNIAFFLQDKKGKYILSADGFGLLTYDDLTGYFHPFKLVNDTIHPEQYQLIAPFIDKDNHLWVCLAGRGLLSIDTKDRSYRFYDLAGPEKKHNFRTTAWVNVIIQASDNALWLGTNNGVIRLDPATGTKKYFGHPMPNMEHSIGGIYEDDDHSIWLGTWGQGLLHLYPEMEKWEQYFIRPAKIDNTENILHSILKKSANECWIGSLYGVQIFDKTKKTFRALADIREASTYKETGRVPGPVPGFELIRDASGNLWSEESKSLRRIIDPANAFAYHMIDAGTAGRSGAFQFTYLIPDPFDANMIYATADMGAGLYHYSTDKKTVELISINGTAHAPVNRALRRGDELWLCMESGLFCYDMRQHKFLPLPQKLNDKVKNAYLTDIAFTKDHIWVGGNGLLRYNTVTGQTDNAAALGIKLPSPEINKLTADDHDNLWIAAGGGKNIFCITSAGTFVDYNTKKEILPGNGEAFCTAASGDIYFASRGNGLMHITHPLQQNEQIELYNVNDGLPSNRIHQLYADSKGMIWCSTSNGLSIYDPKAKQFTNLNYNTFFPQEDLYGQPAETANGNILFPLRYGYTIINRDSLLQHASGKFIPLAIQKFTVNGRPWKESVDTGGNISLTYKENNLSLDFSALCFDDAAGISYNYRVKGLQNEWVNIYRNNITLYGIPPGTYTLEIRVKTRNGIAQEKGYDLKFRIHAPFWQQWWFRIACFIIVLLLLYAMYRYRIRQIMRMQKIRNDIARDLHDDVGSSMTTISILSDVAQKQLSAGKNPESIISDIGTNSRKMLDNLDDIVWSVNTGHDSLEEMILRLKQAAIELLENKGILTVFHVDENASAVVLSMDQRRNIYPAIKEALHNISKYSSATETSVNIKKQNKSLMITVSDNGKGFDVKEKAGSGNGLQNMKARAEACGGSAEIISSENKGTVITWKFPLK